MKSFLLLVITTFTVFSAIDAAVSRERPHPDRRINGCYSKKTGHMVAGEEKDVPNRCETAECGRGGGVTYRGCGVKHTDDSSCYVTDYDLTKKHPDCCPQVKCKDLLV